MLSGILLYCPLALPATSSNISSLYHRPLRLDDENVSTILFESEVDFVTLISYLWKIGQAINNAFECKTTILCLFSTFLFIGGS